MKTFIVDVVPIVEKGVLHWSKSTCGDHTNYPTIRDKHRLALGSFDLYQRSTVS